jgi:hypothetical protein
VVNACLAPNVYESTHEPNLSYGSCLAATVPAATSNARAKYEFEDWKQVVNRPVHAEGINKQANYVEHEVGGTCCRKR